MGIEMAILQPKLRLSVIQVEQFPHLAQSDKVLSVPTAALSPTVQIAGVVPAPRFASILVQASLSRDPLSGD